MSAVQCRITGSFGPHHVATVDAVDRPHEIDVHPRAFLLQKPGDLALGALNLIDVGEPVARRPGELLVDWGAESFQGSHRAWVPEALVAAYPLAAPPSGRP